MATLVNPPQCGGSSASTPLGVLTSQVLNALQHTVTNHNLAVQQAPPPPEPTPPTTAPAKTPARPLPVNSFQVKRSGDATRGLIVIVRHVKSVLVVVQVKMLRYGRQTVSVDVDSGVLLFDRKAGSFGVERISHERSEWRPAQPHANVFPADVLLAVSPSGRQAPEQDTHGHRQPSQHAAGDDV